MDSYMWSSVTGFFQLTQFINVVACLNILFLLIVWAEYILFIISSVDGLFSYYVQCFDEHSWASFCVDRFSFLLTVYLKMKLSPLVTPGLTF